MRALFYVLGIILLVTAGACAVAELLHMTAGSGYQPVSLGSIWFNIHANSLVGFQALVEKQISPAVWSPIQFMLEWPAWLVLAPLGLILAIACRRKQRGLNSRF